MRLHFISIGVVDNGSITKRSIFSYIGNFILDIMYSTCSENKVLVHVLVLVREGRVLDTSLSGCQL